MARPGLAHSEPAPGHAILNPRTKRGRKRVRSVGVVDVGFSHLARPHSFILVRINTEGGPSGIGDSAMIHGDGAKAAADGRVIALAEDRRTRTRRNGE